jgi:hypothetical protein
MSSSSVTSCSTFAAGAWVGKSKCHMEVDFNEDRTHTWLDRVLPCRPLKSVSWQRGVSGSSQDQTPLESEPEHLVGSLRGHVDE